jgi:cell division protein ZapA (FtsZ GTPase activity inhibitor)
MKQKYTVTIADMDLNLISDASPDEVENVARILDRRIRDINLKSPRCTKIESALLCALSCCSERLSMQEAFKKVEKDAFRYAGENEKLKRTIEDLQSELDSARKDVEMMRSILGQAAQNAQAEKSAEPKFVPTTPAEKKAVEEEVIQLSAFDIPEQPVAEVPAATVPEENTAAEQPENAEDATSVKKAPKSSKNRVGTMFDLLTFSDI